MASRKQEWKRRNPEKVWAAAAAHNSRLRAKKKGLTHEITAEYILSILPEECPIFETEFVFYGNKVPGAKSATIDRIWANEGYIPGNIRIISGKANRIKNAYMAEDVLRVGNWLLAQEKL